MTIKINDKVAEKFKALAEELGMGYAELINYLITRYKEQ